MSADNCDITFITADGACISRFRPYFIRKKHNTFSLHFTQVQTKQRGRPTYDRQICFMFFHLDRTKYKI